MSALKVVVIGANDANAEEIKHVLVASIGGSAEIITTTLENYQTCTGADLYICLVNRQQEVENVFGVDNVVALTLVPPTEYFLQISRIPANSAVLLFNNSTSGTVVVMDFLRKYGLMHVKYEIVPYDEMSDQQVAKKLASAKIITGGIAYVDQGKALNTRFGHCIAKDAIVLVSPPRIATSESINLLSRVFSSLYHKKIVEELKRLSAVDYLTQIPNRRTFDERLGIEWSRAQREDYSLSLAMIDIDFFKLYNDHYGHISGDECIKVIAQAIQNMMRGPEDFCARYGGEEFAIILPNTEIDGARHVLEEIRMAIMLLEITHGHSSVAPVVTISIGASTTFPASANITLQELLKRADKALYKAKNKGRNRVIMLK